MAVQPWREGIVTAIENETATTRRFWIQVPELSCFDFVPGQFVTLDLPIDEKPTRRWRSYSIASWPDGSNTFELVIVLLEGGRGTHYLFENITVGSSLILRGPQGVFTLKMPVEKNIFFICTGTGIAPFRSMLHYLKLHNIPHQQIYLLFGTRTRGDLLYFNEMKELDDSMPNFHYMPTLSREQWDGCMGYVHNLYEAVIKEQQVNSGDLPVAEFFLCGWKNMIDEAKQRITALGYDRKCIHQELYG